ncbi:helix-turn-helix transcriptional regulator [Luteimonas terrae]|uniref:helix-turn-helix transcriptional regulator n=1 Tax=Luteimonas terrae TaxID=1530191 RepID=UPI003D2F86E5
MRRKEVQEVLSIGRTTSYEMGDRRSPRFDPNFPRPIRIGNSVGFIAREVEAYLAHLMQLRSADVETPQR